MFEVVLRILFKHPDPAYQLHDLTDVGLGLRKTEAGESLKILALLGLEFDPCVQEFHSTSLRSFSDTQLADGRAMLAMSDESYGRLNDTNGTLTNTLIPVGQRRGCERRLGSPGWKELRVQLGGRPVRSLDGGRF